MPRHSPNLDDQGRKAREALNRLARHERHSQIALALLIVLNLTLLALVVSYLWEHPWVRESVRRVTP